MKRWRKWLIAVAALLVLLLAADTAASFLVSTRRVSRAITARLEAAFGRPVEVGSYSFSLWEGPRIEADAVTVGEAPGFGEEYFLRAQSVAATLRWSSLLRGRVEFGSFSLSQPSLNVVDVRGRWNLESWLPPASPGAAGARFHAPRLYRIGISGGRINFKHGVDKLPFALVDVNGSVDQSGPGRWTLSLDAQPMRAAVNLQDAGTLHLSGVVGGTSARLRPATLRLRWGDASLSDVLRLAFGYDYGVRGREDLDLVASSSGGLWHFEVDAHVRGVHRWDFISEPGNPNVNARLVGNWSPGEGKLQLTGGQIAAPASFIAVSGGFDWPVAGAGQPRSLSAGPQLHLNFTSSGIGAGDLLAWYRSFHSGISPALRASGWLEGSLELDGWPPRIHQAVLTTDGLRVEGGALPSPVDLTAANLKCSPGKASLLLSGLDFGPRAGRFRLAGSASDLGAWKYRLDAAGSTSNLGALARAAQALGARLSGYWKEFGGSGKMQLHWSGNLHPFEQKLRASLDLHDAVWREPSLPGQVLLDRARVQIVGNRFRIDVPRATTLGASWHGWLERRLPDGAWRFNLAADRLDVRALTAKLQPQLQRPSLLERIFGFGHAEGSPPLWLASLDADGQMRASKVLVTPLALEDVSGDLAIHQGRLELSHARGRFYGGPAEGLLVFSVRNRVPVWRLTARLQDANLAGISRAIEGGTTRERFSGRLSGTVDASARGTTAAALLDSLDGEANLSLFGARDSRIDWLSTLEAGHSVAGSSAFRDVSAQMRLAAGKMTFEKLSLSTARERLEAVGTLDLAHGRALEIEARLLPARNGERRGAATAARTYHVTGNTASPRVQLRSPTAAPTPAPQH